MLICWFINTSFKPQKCGLWTVLNNLFLFIHSLWQGANLNQQSTVKTAYMCMHCAHHIAQVLYTTQHRTVLIIFSPYIVDQGL